MKFKTITNKEEIRLATFMPHNVPDEFLLPLKPYAMVKFKGDTSTLNDQFNKREWIPVYISDDTIFAIGKDGKGRKIDGNVWGKLYKIPDEMIETN